MYPRAPRMSMEAFRPRSPGQRSGTAHFLSEARLEAAGQVYRGVGPEFPMVAFAASA